ncbi:MAG: hypothetical protein ACPG4T_02200 [Nannocystaceae bacterium]
MTHLNRLTGLLIGAMIATALGCDSDPKDSAGSASDSETTNATTAETTSETEGETTGGETTGGETTEGETTEGETTEGETQDPTETGETTQPGSETETDSETGEPAPGEVMICGPDAPMDPVYIHDAQIMGDTLYVHLSYSGGCEEHELTSCWDGAFAESEPVQAFTRIAHNANMDPCEAQPEEMLEFDLTPMKTSWQEGYQQDSGTILVHVDGWENTLNYTF